jgi:hypothetical protein
MQKEHMSQLHSQLAIQNMIASDSVLYMIRQFSIAHITYRKKMSWQSSHSAPFRSVLLKSKVVALIPHVTNSKNWSSTQTLLANWSLYGMFSIPSNVFQPMNTINK